MRPIPEWFRRKSKTTAVAAASAESPSPPAGLSPQAPRNHPASEGLFSQLFTGGLVVTLLLVACGLIAMLVGDCIRAVDPKTEIILAGFTGPFDLKADSGNVLGKQASDIFSDDVNEIIEIGSKYVGNQQASGKSRQAQPFDSVPQVPISRNYGIAIQGISIDQLISIWHTIRYDQETVSGDIVPVDNVPGKYVLYLSWKEKSSSANWTSRPFSGTDGEMEAVLDDAARHFVQETNPEIAGRYYLNQEQYAQAVATFSDWMGREPWRPEPFLYLAKTFDSTGDYSRGLPFADRAQALLQAAPRRARKSLQGGIYLAESLQYFYAKDPDLTGFQSYVDRNLPNDPSALTNLGLRALEKGQYGKAEGFLKQALARNQGDFPAEIFLGETYEGQGNHLSAAQAYQTALRLSPQSSPAATGYVEALYQAKDYRDAATFCSSWIYPEGGSTGVIRTIKDRDLFFLCAEAEQASGDPSKDRLRWYYVQSLIHPEGEQPDVSAAIADSKMLVSMHNSVCLVSGPPLPPGLERTQWIAATAALEDAITRRSSLESSMQPFAQDCKQTAGRLANSPQPAGRRPHNVKPANHRGTPST